MSTIIDFSLIEITISINIKLNLNVLSHLIFISFSIHLLIDFVHNFV